MEDLPKPFFEHLEELRLSLIKSLAAVAVGAVIGYQLVDPFIAFLARPVGRFVFLQPTEAFFVRLKVALVLGLLIALPVVLYQGWRFVSVALFPWEKKSILWTLPISYLLFLLGTAFGFFVVVPPGVKFLLSYGSTVVVPNLSIDFYVNFVGILCLVLGMVFEMPLLSFFAAKTGLLDWDWLAAKRRIAVVVIYAASAFLTPGPDPVTAILLAAPTYLLYECSIWTARLAARDLPV